MPYILKSLVFMYEYLFSELLFGDCFASLRSARNELFTRKEVGGNGLLVMMWYECKRLILILHEILMSSN